MTEPPAPQTRAIRSFVLRQGRLTAGQRRALDELWPVFGLSTAQGPISNEEVFGDAGPLCLEIGFGMGDSLLSQALLHPERHYIGVEVHQPGVGHLLLQIEQAEISNIRIYAEDSIDVLRECIAPGTLSLVQVFFPDPWHKKRHHKRRLIDDALISLVADRLTPGGIIHIATDWTPYAESIEALFADRAEFCAIVAPGRPETKFERRGKKLGHRIHDLAFQLSGGST